MDQVERKASNALVATTSFYAEVLSHADKMIADLRDYNARLVVELRIANETIATMKAEFEAGRVHSKTKGRGRG